MSQVLANSENYAAQNYAKNKFLQIWTGGDFDKGVYYYQARG